MSKLRMFVGWEIQTQKITITINIFSKNLFSKIDLYVLHEFSGGHNQASKAASNMQRIA